MKREPIQLAFDPKRSINMELRKVFQDTVARKFWLIYRYNHIVDQNFNTDALRFATAYRVIKPTIASELYSCFTNTLLKKQMGGGQLLRLCVELLPLMLEPEPPYVVVEAGRVSQ